MDLSFLIKFVGPDKIASYTRGLVAAALGFVVTKIPFAADILTYSPVPGVTVQDAIGIAVSGAVVGLWGHLTKTQMPMAVAVMAQNAAKMLAPVMLAFTLVACSDSDLAKFRSGLANFQAGVASVDQTIAATSPTLAKYCGDLQLAGSALVPFVASSKAASGGLAGANAAITTWCQSPPTDISSAIKTLAAEIVAAKAAYTATQRGN